MRLHILLVGASSLALAADPTVDYFPVVPSPLNSREYESYTRALSPDKGSVGAVERDGEFGEVFYASDIASGRKLHRILFVKYNTCCFTPDGTRFVVFRWIRGTRTDADAPQLCTLDVHDLRTGRRLHSTPLKAGQPFGQVAYTQCPSVAVADDVAVVAGQHELGTVYDLRNGGVVGDIPGKTQTGTFFNLSADGRWAAFCADRRVVRTYDVRTRKLDRNLYEHVTDLQALAVSADGRYVATGVAGGMIHVIDRTTGGVKRTHRMPSERFNGLAFAGDGSRLVVSTGPVRRPPRVKAEPEGCIEWGLWLFDWKNEDNKPRRVVTPRPHADEWRRGRVGTFMAHLMTPDGRAFLSIGGGQGLAVLDLDDPDGTKAKKRRPADK